MRLRRLGDFVLAAQETVQRTADELQEFEEARDLEAAKYDTSEYSLVLPVGSFAGHPLNAPCMLPV